MVYKLCFSVTFFGYNNGLKSFWNKNQTYSTSAFKRSFDKIVSTDTMIWEGNKKEREKSRGESWVLFFIVKWVVCEPLYVSFFHCRHQ